MFQQLLVVLFVCVSVAMGGSMDQAGNNGMFNVYYPEDQASAGPCNVVFFGVGTAMSASSYSKLSNRLVEKGHFVVVVADHQPGSLTKLDANKFAGALLEAKTSLFSSWLNGVSSSCTSASKWLVGGHSAGGQAAHEAVSKDATLADAMFQLDPFNLDKLDSIAKPSLIWGFAGTTCFVTVGGAAELAYKKTQGLNRIFYQVQKKNSLGPCGFSPTYFHCSFTDSGCPACTNCKYTPSHFFDDVANSAVNFQANLDNWSDNDVAVDTETPTQVFVSRSEPQYSALEDSAPQSDDDGAPSNGIIVACASVGAILVMAAAVIIHKRVNAKRQQALQATTSFPAL